MFFSFQLALPKTSVLLLCQNKSRFLTFFILFFAPLPLSFAFETFCALPFPLLLKHFALCPLEVCPLFSYSRLFHSLSFGGSLRFFAMSVCFNSDFLTFFILFFALCFFPFAFGTYCSLPFGSLLVFFILCCIIRCLLGAVLALFQCLFVSTVVSLPFCVLFFALCPFPLLLGHFALCPLEVYSFAYSLLFHSLSFWGSLRSFAMPVCFNSRFLTFFILFLPLCPFPLLLKHFALCHFQFYKQPFALYFPLLLFSFFFVCGIHLLRYF